MFLFGWMLILSVSFPFTLSCLYFCLRSFPRNRHIKGAESNFHGLNIHWSIVLFIYMLIFVWFERLLYTIFGSLTKSIILLIILIIGSNFPISFSCLIHSVKKNVPQLCKISFYFFFFTQYVRLFSCWISPCQRPIHIFRANIISAEVAFLFSVSRYTRRNWCNGASADPPLGLFRVLLMESTTHSARSLLLEL